MDRYCTRHSYRGSSRAHRLLLAKHSLDTDAHRHVVAEHQDCAQCWQDTALALADTAHGLLLRSAGTLPHMDWHGNCTGRSVDWLLNIMASSLQAEDLDRRGG
jgi:hypothetical protein